MRRTLNLQADRIEIVLASHRIHARVRGGRITPTGVHFEVLTPLGTRVSKVATLSEELALALGVPHVIVQRNGGLIEVIVPRTERRPIPLARLLRRVREHGTIPRVTALLGLDDEGTPLLLRLPSPDVAHVIVAGTTGSGKTMLMRVMGLTLALWNRQKDVHLVLIDPKRRGLAPLAGIPHVWGPLCARPDDILAVLYHLVTLMERRDREGRARPCMVVLIDELAEVLMLGGRDAQAALTRLVQRGREAGIHIVAATQKPMARVLGGLMKGNFPVRIVGRVASVEDARVAAGIPGSGAEKLRGHGEFLLVAGGEVIRFLAPYVDRATLEKAVATVGGRARAPRQGLNVRSRPRGRDALPVSIVPPRPTDWAWEVGRGREGDACPMTHDAPRTTPARASCVVRRASTSLAAQMLAVWEEAGELLSLTETPRRLGRAPGGSLWHTYAAAYRDAAAVWQSSSSPSSSSSSPQPRPDGEGKQEEEVEEEVAVGVGGGR